MKESVENRENFSRRAKALSSLSLGLVTVGFAAGLYVPVSADTDFYTPYVSEGGMIFCVCETTEKICAPCAGA